MDLRMLSRELSLYLEHQVRVGFFGSGVGLSLILGFSVAYACYYLSSIAKKRTTRPSGAGRAEGRPCCDPSSPPSPPCGTGMNVLKRQMEDRFYWTGLITITVRTIWTPAPDLLSYCCPASLEQARSHISFI
uniref:Abhydrolase domain containing 3, phospholipase n=1 Tax=Pipistrellus kuhlii TaxID=59472 RepID=A0A7J7Y7A0_PIPKU|nr:abhydrolase domain containing 3, phospholipase [Pipistrellus kuhlii]